MPDTLALLPLAEYTQKKATSITEPSLLEALEARPAAVALPFCHFAGSHIILCDALLPSELAEERAFGPKSNNDVEKEE